MLGKTNYRIILPLFLVSALLSIQWYRNSKLESDVECLKRELESVIQDRNTGQRPLSAGSLDDFMEHSFDVAESFESMREMMDQFVQRSISSFDAGFESSIFDDFSSIVPNIRVEDIGDTYEVTVRPFNSDTHEVELDLTDHTLTMKFIVKSSRENRTSNEFGFSDHVARSEQVMTRLITLEEASSDSALETEIDENTLKIVVTKDKEFSLP